MAAIITAGHHAIVYVSGAPATMTTEPTTKATGNKIFQITEPTHRVIDPTFALTQNWSVGPTGTSILINRLTGTVTSDVDETTHTLTLSGKYLEMQPVLYCKDFSMDGSGKLNEITPFNQNYQSVLGGLHDVTGTLSNFYDPLEVAALTTPVYFNTKLMADATIAVKLKVHANLEVLAWAVIDSEELKNAIDGVLEQTISWSGSKDLEGHVFSRL